MADVNYDNIPSIIGIYEGTVASFEDIMNGTDTAKKQTFYGRLILITGDQTATDENAADRKQALWTSEEDGSNAHYLNMSDVATLKAQLAHIDGIAFPKSDGTSGYDTYDLTGGKGFIFKGSNGITVKINPATSTDIDGKPYWTIEVDGKTLETSLIGTSANGSDTSTHPDTITGAKAYADSLKTSVEGDSNKDTFTSPTIAGAKKYADKVKTALEGTKAEDDTTAQTIEGAKEYADNAVAKIVSDGNDAAADDTIKGAKLYADAATAALLGKSNDGPAYNTIYGAKAYADTKDITIDSTNNDDTLAGKFVIKKNGVEIATINIPKELVVTEDGSEIVKGTWSGDTFTESETGPDKALKLAIQNQTTPIYINVADLVDVYTAEDTATIDITISTDNKISASVKGNSIQTSMLVNEAVTTAKIANRNVTTDKIADGAVSYDKLDQSVKASLDKADNAVTDIGINISADDANYLSGNRTVSDTIRTINLDVKTETISNATSDTTKKGLATAEDVAAYLAARLSVKVVS